MMKNIAQRLFGHTIIDALLLKLNAWYINEVQVTATAAQLNSMGTVITPTAKSVTASNLGTVTGPGLQGGNGAPVEYNPAQIHVLIAPGIGATGTIAIPAMAAGDGIPSVLEFTFAGVMRDATSGFSSRAGYAEKTSGTTNIGGLTWLIWADYT